MDQSSAPQNSNLHNKFGHLLKYQNLPVQSEHDLDEGRAENLVKKYDKITRLSIPKVKKKCGWCNKCFTTNYNCRRHEKAVHGGTSNGSSNATGGSSCSCKGKGARKMLAENGRTENDEPEWKFWKQLVTESVQDMSKVPDDDKELLLDGSPLSAEFLDLIRQKLENRIELATYMETEDPIYEQLQETAQQYVDKNGLEQKEAFEKAWDERKYLLKRYLRQHMEQIEELTEDRNSDVETDETVTENEAGVDEGDGENKSNDGESTDETNASGNDADNEDEESDVSEEQYGAGYKVELPTKTIQEQFILNAAQKLSKRPYC